MLHCCFSAMVVLRKCCAVGVWAAPCSGGLSVWTNSTHLTVSTCPSEEVTHPYWKSVTDLLPFFKKIKRAVYMNWKGNHRQSCHVDRFSSHEQPVCGHSENCGHLSPHSTEPTLQLTFLCFKHRCFGLEVGSVCSSLNSFKLPKWQGRVAAGVILKVKSQQVCHTELVWVSWTDFWSHESFAPLSSSSCLWVIILPPLTLRKTAKTGSHTDATNFKWAIVIEHWNTDTFMQDKC